MITEGLARIKTSKNVFYNPVMKLNRDISVLLLKALNRKMTIADIMAATGVRSIRFLKELKGMKVFINDNSKEAARLIKQNLKLNKIKAKVSNEEGNLFLMKSKGFDYIDVDPFGSPNPFLDTAVKKIARDGILAVTSTDPAALTGTYKNACRRKYWAEPLHNHMMHEIGLRILIRKIQLIGAQYDKALTPMFSYSKDHYLRVFLKCEKGKKKVDEIIKKQGIFQKAGPMWLGKLWDSKLTEKILKISSGEARKLLEIINEEATIDSVGFYSIHKLCKEGKIRQVPKISEMIESIKQKGFKASRTHFLGDGIRTDLKTKPL